MKTLGSIGFGVLVGFIITVTLSVIYPGLGYILGGFIGGIVAGLLQEDSWVAQWLVYFPASLVP